MKNLLKQALESKKCVSVTCNGQTRIIEVHACGKASTGNDNVRVWQVRGGSNSGKPTGWKMMSLHDMQNATIVDEASQTPRTGYKRGDKGLRIIYFQV